MDDGVVWYRPMLWKLPPPTSPFPFPLLFIFLSMCVPPLTSLLAMASCMNSSRSSSSSVSSRLPVKATAMSRTGELDLFRLRDGIGDAPENAAAVGVQGDGCGPGQVDFVWTRNEPESGHVCCASSLYKRTLSSHVPFLIPPLSSSRPT